MKTLIQRFQQLHNDEAGQGLVEYIMLIALVITAAVACFPGLSLRSQCLHGDWHQAGHVRQLAPVVGRHSGRVLPRSFCLLRLERAGANTT